MIVKELKKRLENFNDNSEILIAYDTGWDIDTIKEIRTCRFSKKTNGDDRGYVFFIVNNYN